MTKSDEVVSEDSFVSASGEFDELQLIRLDFANRNHIQGGKGGSTSGSPELCQNIMMGAALAQAMWLLPSESPDYLACAQPRACSTRTHCLDSAAFEKAISEMNAMDSLCCDTATCESETHEEVDHDEFDEGPERRAKIMDILYVK
ncbi:unnamed protein product [Polarella glacialis]|uniref:Uncharacterized protein n=1 Tax=Polarella glacialis TaxID=89957 RepID=A0A813GDN8_POLGL|nr:unnamed protein product [Polarella glacialis]